jgi:hypothetical protein
MPPQQSGGLLDLLDDGLDFRAHGRAPGRLCNRLRRRAQRAVPHPTIANPAVLC